MSGIFAFAAVARRPAQRVRFELHAVEVFCADIGQFGPAGMAHAAGLKLAAGASDEELRCLIRSCVATSRMFRPSSRFDFVSSLGHAHGAYCVIAWLLFGVVRSRNAARFSRINVGDVVAPWNGKAPVV